MAFAGDVQDFFQSYLSEGNLSVESESGFLKYISFN